MAITLAQRMTRWLKRQLGVVPVDWRAHYSLWRKGDEGSALEILAEFEDDADQAEDEADLEAFELGEELRTARSEVTFMRGNEQPAQPSTVEPSTQDAARPTHSRRMEENPNAGRPETVAPTPRVHGAVESVVRPPD